MESPFALSPFKEGELNNLFDILLSGSDLSAVLRSEHFLNVIFTRLLKKSLRKGKSTDDLLDLNKGAINTTFQKIRLLYCLKIISKDVYTMVQKLLEIRNIFAHSYKEILFQDSDIAEKCNLLRTNIIFREDILNFLLKKNKENARIYFIVAVTSLVSHIASSYLTEFVGNVKSLYDSLA